LKRGWTVAEEHEDGFTPLILAKPDDSYDVILGRRKIVPSCVAFRYADNK